MKLLFDENLSPRLAALLSDIFPDSTHVDTIGLGNTDDREVWEYARVHGFTLVSKDSDHYELSMVRGHPPKVIWVRLGNCSTKTIEQKIRTSYPAIANFDTAPDQAAFLL